MRRTGTTAGDDMGIHQHLWAATRRASRLHVHSQEVAIRNAMVASTALTQRRRELNEVEAFLTQHQRRYDARVGVALQRNRSA